MTRFHSLSSREARQAFWFILPSMVALIVVALYPILNTLWLSLNKVSLVLQVFTFHGLKNYSRLLTDPKFINAWKNTIFFTLVSVGLETLLGLFIALVIIKNFRGRALTRASVLVPWAIPTVVSSKMWEWIFNSNYGVMNYFLLHLGLIGKTQNWLGTRGMAMNTAIFVDVWKTTPFMALLILAGLTSIPQDIFESAKIDGAGSLQAFFSITLPLIKQILLISMLLRTLDAFRVFDLIFILTKGGPADSTEVLSTYTYKTLFSVTNFGYGSTLAMSMFFTVLAIAIVYFFLTSAREDGSTD
ncbi:MAG: sugar ABC transporter permease [Atribacterota bacterium]